CASIDDDGQYLHNAFVHLLKSKFSNRKSITTSGGRASHHHVIYVFLFIEFSLTLLLFPDILFSSKLGEKLG
ncbi:MAG: hypothetical protein J7L72_01285, partial [Candidatus Aminicenantes bacterium]|nr:hypothetical protein [Candidatus Aminicenantes bacterium]